MACSLITMHFKKKCDIYEKLARFARNQTAEMLAQQGWSGTELSLFSINTPALTLNVMVMSP